MLRAIGLTAALTVLAAGACGDRYADNDLELITSFRARHMCSCLFVIGQTEEFCERWTRQDPPVATYTVDWDRRAVDSQALLMWGARARYVDAHFGCMLE